MTNTKGAGMKRGSTLFLRLAGLGLGAAVAAFCVIAIPLMWMAVPDEYPNITYVFYGMFVAMYAAAVPFYIALYYALQLLGYVDKGRAFSGQTVRALRYISYCAAAISLAFAINVPLFYVWAQADDAPGLVVIGMVLAAAPLTVAVFAGVLQRLFGEALNIKSENDLTV